MKGTEKVITKPVKVTTGEDNIDSILFGKELSEWVHCTNKLSENMGQSYNVILGQCTTFIRSKTRETQQLRGNIGEI